MQTTKHRLEAFVDGVIAIIITIMVLSIPLPKTFIWKDLLEFSSSLTIYLLSFLVVGAFWNQHHQAFSYLDKVNQKIIAVTIFYLFFLSLIPLFTKWVIENQGSLIPVIGYDIVYLMVSFFYMFTYRLIIEHSNHEELKQITENIRSRQATKPHYSWMPIIILFIITFIVIALSIYLPKVFTIVLMGIPIVSSILNLVIPDHVKRKPRKRDKKEGNLIEK